MEEKKTCAQCAYFVMREEVPITEKNIMGEIILLKHMEKVMRTCPEIHRDSRKKERYYEPDVYPYATHGRIIDLGQRIEQYTKEHPAGTFRQWVKNIVKRFEEVV